MLDITPHIVLEGGWQNKYLLGRKILAASFAALIIILAYWMLFPTTRLTYSFSDSKKQTTLIADFAMPDKSTSFSAFDSEPRTRIEAELTLADGAIGPDARMTVSKNFKAFTYPLKAEPASFPDGALVKSDGKYFIISEGNARQFKDTALMEEMGFLPDAFLEATAEELSLSGTGETISQADQFPDYATFNIGGKYYELREGALHEFTSPEAFSSRYLSSQAVFRDPSFLDRYPLAAEKLGFADGSLLSFSGAVFVIVDGKAWPFSNPATFLSFGYLWDDVIGIPEEESQVYGKGSLFGMQQPHPSGTVFQERESGSYFLIAGGSRQEVRGSGILKARLKRTPIAVSRENATFSADCRLKQSWLFRNRYSCAIKNETVGSLPGNSYRFHLEHQDPLKLEALKITFPENLTKRNLFTSLSNIRNRFYSHYNYVPQP